jgi:hypothetical protein
MKMDQRSLLRLKTFLTVNIREGEVGEFTAGITERSAIVSVLCWERSGL